MTLDRSARSILATLLLLTALFLAMSRIVDGAPLADWLLPLILFVVGAAFIPDWDLSRMRPTRQPSAPPSNIQTYNVSTQTTTRPHTMTIRPDPESSEYQTSVTVTKEPSGDDVLPFDEAASGSDPLPFIEGANAPDAPAISPDSEAPASPETPAPAIVAEPEPEVVPVSPETPAPNAPEEPSVASPETPTPEPQYTSTGGSDDLARLSGIGQKSAAALAAAGIDTFQKLADSSEENIRAALSDGGVRLVGNVDVNVWAQQAAYAARGDWDGLAQFNADRKSSSTDGE